MERTIYHVAKGGGAELCLANRQAGSRGENFSGEYQKYAKWQEQPKKALRQWKYAAKMKMAATTTVQRINISLTNEKHTFCAAELALTCFHCQPFECKHFHFSILPTRRHWIVHMCEIRILASATFERMKWLA